eukprot:TRINITY_DN10200_c0_g1_i3.p1 TRINITY_DN10200_c0_g1~~TRINITY_DN10200_c0_g1_i3.p1  ORF type:complete len:155 (-),score=13.10 TRINITY_DN10200_c0_g1_i3:509-973(-)
MECMKLLPDYSLPKEVPSDFTPFSVETVHIDDAIIALTKTLHSQSRCIESLDQEFRVFKSDVKDRLDKLERHLASPSECKVADIGLLSADIRNVWETVNRHENGQIEWMKQLEALGKRIDDVTGSIASVGSDLTGLQLFFSLSSSLIAQGRRTL